MAKRVSTCSEYFTDLPERFIPEKANGVDAKYVFKLEGEGGGTWTATVQNNTLTVSEGAAPDAAVTLEMKPKDWVDMANGDLGGMKAVFTRKLKVSGNMVLAKRMNDFMPPGDGK
ncbi:MAG TPA: SCP2 sterol-binding domain-containing protein [Polyangiaceae bacterium]|nr:SCP2 sterol-binding domain-containing protein [Polyangiaceae bacterium]